MPRSFLIKKARSADRNGMAGTGCHPGLDLRTHLPASVSIKGRWTPRLEEIGPRGGRLGREEGEGGEVGAGGGGGGGGGGRGGGGGIAGSVGLPIPVSVSVPAPVPAPVLVQPPPPPPAPQPPARHDGSDLLHHGAERLSVSMHDLPGHHHQHHNHNHNHNHNHHHNQQQQPQHHYQQQQHQQHQHQHQHHHQQQFQHQHQHQQHPGLRYEYEQLQPPRLVPPPPPRHPRDSPPPPPLPPLPPVLPPETERVRTEPAFAALAPYTPTAMEPLSVRLANGYIHDMYAPSRMYPSSLPSGKDHLLTHVSDNDIDLYAKTTPREDDVRSNASSGITVTLHDDQHSIMSMDSAEDLRKPSPESSGSGAASPKGAAFQSGVTVAYTYDAFFITDGRSRRRNHLGLAIPDQTRPKYTCNECGKQYATSSNLSRHKQTHRSLESPNAKKCPHCDKVYVSMPALSMHILTHNLKHQCPVCGKAFSRPWLLQGHIRSHSGEKPYGCAHCGKAFADRSNLRAHMQTHSSFKHYECKRCNKTFALKSYLNKHYESACLRDTASNASLNSAPSSPEPFIDVQH